MKHGNHTTKELGNDVNRLLGEDFYLHIKIKNMKLELKHLSAYLPYRLKAEMVDYESDYVGIKYDEIIGVHQWSKNKDWCLLTNGGSKPSFGRIKPILRPLSDLAKEIEVNGKWIFFKDYKPE